MLNNLIESTGKVAENGRRGRYMGVTFMAVGAVLCSVWTVSLFRTHVGMWDGDDDVASLMAPISIAAEQPPVPEPKAARQSSAQSAPKKVRLPEFYDSIDKGAPQDTAGKPNVIDSTKFDPSILDKGPLSIPDDAGSSGTGVRGSGGKGSGLGGDSGGSEDGVDDAPPIKKPEPVIPKQVSGGVVNGKAIHLETPAYSVAAKSIRAAGQVEVEVLIDENGRVLSARAKSGHPLLRGSAEKAAMASRFTPTFLSNQAVKVNGIIIYRFTA